jgi:soluble lytic murein transglycosylase-like protein
MSAAALPVAAVGGSGGEQHSAIAAAERVQQLQALIAQVEHRPAIGGSTRQTGSTFAATLNAAQAGASPTDPATDAYPGASPTDAYPGASPTDTYPGASPTDTYPGTSPTELPNYAYSTAASSPASTGGTTYAPLIEQAAAHNGLDPAVLYGLIEQESGFDPSARSGAGALGLTQLMPSTAASLGVAEPLDPAQSIEGGARYLSQLLHEFAGNTADALAAYNAGPGAVRQYGGVPPYPETQQYVTKVLGYAASYQGGGIA